MTLLPELKGAEQLVAPPPQLIPAGLLVTVPLADGAVMETENCGVGGGPKLAVTDWLEDIVTEQAPVPVQAPLQPANADPAPGAAARFTTLLLP